MDSYYSLVLPLLSLILALTCNCNCLNNSDNFEPHLQYFRPKLRFYPKRSLADFSDLQRGHSKIHAVSRRSTEVESTFKLPSPLPDWPKGGGFASGTIDLGGLMVKEVTTFNKVWATYEGGPEDTGATFFEPTEVPDGFFTLGYYAQPNNRPLYGRVLVGKDGTNDAQPALHSPIDYALVWSSNSLRVKEDAPGYIWAPIPRSGYAAVGLVVTTTPDKPPLKKVRCVRADLTTRCEPEEWIWGREAGQDVDEFNIFETRAGEKAKQGIQVSAGTFMARSGGGTTGDLPLLACLKNVKRNFSSMPNMEQLDMIIKTYAPKIYSHPDEKYLPASVNWLFENGAQLYKKGQESNPVKIEPNGANLPQGGSNDLGYWIDLPKDKQAREHVERGDIPSASAYFHIKPMHGGTHTDLAIWLFFPFNGGGFLRIGSLTIPLGQLGEHVSDWEHITLRVSNFNGMLRKVFFSQHAAGEWIHAPELEFVDGNRFVGYSSLHGHACFYKPGQISHGNSDFIGISNGMERSNKIFDTAKGYEIISADYLQNHKEPPWLNFARPWGPKITYDITKEVDKVADSLPGKLKKGVHKFIHGLPAELLGERGPTGPKFKWNWDGDEIKCC